MKEIKSKAAAIRWIKNRGRGRPNAELLKQAIKVLGGKRAYNKAVEEVKAGKAVSASKPKPKARAKPKAATRKKSTYTPHKGRKKSTYRPSDDPSRKKATAKKKPAARKKSTVSRRPRKTGLDAILEAQGLQEIFNICNSYYFNNRITASISWKRMRGKWGTYDTRKRHINIATALKDAPIYVIAATVYHEMLHEDIPVRYDNRGCRVIHGPDFRKREKLFPWYKESVAWKNSHSTSSEGPQSMYGLKVGQEMVIQGQPFRIIGFSPSAHTYKVRALQLWRNKTYKLRLDQIPRSNPHVCPMDYHEAAGHEGDVIMNPKQECPLDRHDALGHEDDVIF